MNSGVEHRNDLARRQHERFRLGGVARLVVDHPDGLITASGHLIDLSEGGCQLRFFRRVDLHLAARVRLEVGGEAFWMPVLTRWIRRDPNGWMVGCSFDRPTEEKQLFVRALLDSQSQLIA
jgi:hypothetical protein